MTHFNADDIFVDLATKLNEAQTLPRIFQRAHQESPGLLFVLIDECIEYLKKTNNRDKAKELAFLRYEILKKENEPFDNGNGNSDENNHNNPKKSEYSESLFAPKVREALAKKQTNHDSKTGYHIKNVLPDFLIQRLDQGKFEFSTWEIKKFVKENKSKFPNWDPEFDTPHESNKNKKNPPPRWEGDLVSALIALVEKDILTKPNEHERGFYKINIALD